MSDETEGGALGDLRLSDLVVLLIVARTGSVTATGRELKVTPSQASKALARVEAHYRLKLLTRGPKKMVLTDAGRALVPAVQAAVSALEVKAGDASELTIAGPSYLVGIVVAAIAEAQPDLRLRGLELAPSQIRATLTEGLFDLGLCPGGAHGLPPTWTSDRIEGLRQVLVGPPALVENLALPITIDQARELPFVGTLSSLGGRFVPIHDDCPLPVAERTIIHRVQTFGAALELAIRAKCVAFGPWIAARRHLCTGELVEIPVQGWAQNESLDLLCNGDLIRDRLRKQLVTTLQRELASGGAAAE
ncbi:MAG TPA: LysR family transcriptional regulator [Kofleriaceae bacterium]